MCLANGRGSARRSAARVEGSTPTTCQTPSTSRELDVVRSYQVGANDVDQVAGGQVARQQQLAGMALEASEVIRLPGQRDVVGLQLGDARDRDEQVAVSDVARRAR